MLQQAIQEKFLQHLQKLGGEATMLELMSSILAESNQIIVDVNTFILQMGYQPTDVIKLTNGDIKCVH